MVSGGLSWTDVGDARAIGGLARRFYAAVAEHYGAGLWEVKGPEPHVAETAAGGDARRRRRAPRTSELQKQRSTSTRAYEGDLLAQLDVPYASAASRATSTASRGRDGNPRPGPGSTTSPCVLSPFADDGSLLPFIREPELDERGWPADRFGEGDGGLQAYGFRVCLTDRPENKLPLDAPAAYDPGAFELLRRYLHAAPGLDARDLLGLVPDLLPNGKCDVNSIGPFSLNLLDGSNRDYPDGSPGERAASGRATCDYAQGAAPLPGTRRRRAGAHPGEVARWGPCADEFADTDGWPHQLYVRDGRRHASAPTCCASRDLLDARPQPDAVALGSYNVDIREVERTWRYLPEYVRVPAVFNEGYLSVAVPPYPIPYGSLVPRREDCTNLLVPVCLSASHVAFGSVRMEPTLMLLGEVAGRAAAQAARRGVAVQDVDVEDARAGQVLAL